MEYIYPQIRKKVFLQILISARRRVMIQCEPNDSVFSTKIHSSSYINVMYHALKEKKILR